MATVETLLQDLAHRLGLTDLEPEENGLITLMIDGNLPTFLQFTADPDGVLLFAGIGTIPDEEAEPVCRALLESNHFWMGTGGFTLSLIPGTLNVLLSARSALDVLDGAALFDLFDRFVTAARTWRQRLPMLVENTPGATLRTWMAEAQNPPEPLVNFHDRV